jgi:sister-chromatid-cohesion protein PDS5
MLQKLSEVLEQHDQDHDETSSLDEIAAALIQASILKHQKEEVRLLAALCLADIIRIYAPEAPYDATQLEVRVAFYRENQLVA